MHKFAEDSWAVHSVSWCGQRFSNSGARFLVGSSVARVASLGVSKKVLLGARKAWPGLWELKRVWILEGNYGAN